MHDIIPGRIDLDLCMIVLPTNTGFSYIVIKTDILKIRKHSNIPQAAVEL
jgi:hypothetical protein